MRDDRVVQGDEFMRRLQAGGRKGGREGGREGGWEIYRFARRSKGCFISDGAFELRLTSLYYYVAGMSWPVRCSEVHM